MSTRPPAPEAPMIVEGGVVPGDTKFMLRCMVEELFQGGVPSRDIDAMSRDANYQALFAARLTLGDAAFAAVLADAAACVGVQSCRVRETPPATFAATLTIGGAADGERGTS